MALDPFSGNGGAVAGGCHCEFYPHRGRNMPGLSKSGIIAAAVALPNCRVRDLAQLDGAKESNEDAAAASCEASEGAYRLLKETMYWQR